METLEFDKFLLKTAFSCMACDGNIDKRELKLIKQLHNENKAFGEIDLNKELDALLIEINEDGQKFLKGFFNELKNSNLSEQNELKLIEVAIETIKADEVIEYSEVKFFKVIRSNLKIENDPILEKHPDFEDYLEQDIITDSYLKRLQEDFFDTHTSNEFSLLNEIDQEVLDSLKEKKDE